jgi:hypothetical protein
MPLPELDKDQGILPHIMFADAEMSSGSSTILAFRSSDDGSLDIFEDAAPSSTATAAASSVPDEHASQQQQQQSMCSLLCQPGLAAMSAVLLLCWFTIMFSYYGVALGLGGLPGSL